MEPVHCGDMGVLASFKAIPLPLRIVLGIVLGAGILGAVGLAALVVLGRATRWVFRGPARSDWSASWAGDLNGDGVPEIVLTLRYESCAVGGGLGRVRILDGRTKKCLFDIDRPSPIAIVHGLGDDSCQPAICGSSLARRALTDVSRGELLRLESDDDAMIAFAGDIDGDGCMDWFVSQPFEGPRSKRGSGAAAGVVRILSGRTGEKLFEHAGKPGEGFGWRTCRLGDVDGDGRDDFAVASDGQGIDRHLAVIFSGATGQPLRELEFPPGQYRDTLACAGDVDGDGRADICLGAYGLDAGGIVRVYSGRDGALLREIRNAQTRFGRGIEAVGDVDADGFADIACDSDGPVLVVSGRTGATLLELAGEPGEGVGDLDGDGHADVLLVSNRRLGEDDPDDTAWDLGELKVVSGRTGAVLLAITGADIRALHK